ncbi:MAG TPA: hypothetical protein VEF05_07295 [Terriglobales bacterium]|nr:hypothetical protein [Terriglobales bacterium]
MLGSILNANGCTPTINCTTVKVGIGTAAPSNVFTIAQGRATPSPMDGTLIDSERHVTYSGIIESY